MEEKGKLWAHKRKSICQVKFLWTILLLAMPNSVDHESLSAETMGNTACQPPHVLRCGSCCCFSLLNHQTQRG
ncbi:hypothetical protein MANES_16G083850v8 [Manihot esculenta]|uniref:Uncharacterized protein n=1 Tax=Manihot esculenta TaxID=3983 RepID=A0ACB7G6W8_MANES|nr:hypothetical protein MANES_16G083850v8 [Manihot esculenta]